MSKRILQGLCYIFVFAGVLSCAPVKFTKSDSIVVTPLGGAISCTPLINGSVTSFTYSSSSSLPNIASRCNQTTNVTYEWTLKNADGTVLPTLPELSGINPSNVDMQPLGPGSYYVFLKVTDDSGILATYNSSTPLEFIVPGTGGGALVCDPKLNSTLNSVVIGDADANPSVTANCNPTASTYIWTVRRNGAEVVVPNLGGAHSPAPDFKSLGSGTYQVSLYATATGFTSWQTTTPLTVQVTSNPTGTEILCNPRINGSLTSLTLTPSSPNPLISANCVPNDIQYNWTVTKNGQSVSINGLAGANSNPNFVSHGEGTYLIYLTGSKPGHVTWTATAPLIITVDGSGPGNMVINCSPRLNGTFVAMTVSTTGSNPTVTSSCTPANVTHTWTVTKNGQTISLPGLSGSSSTPNFIGSGLGTYLIYLTASAPGYNTYVSPSPLEVTVANGNPIVRRVTFTKLVEVSNNKVDILLVVDDSNSMLPENQRLAGRLQNFVNDLSASGLDWQMCATITRAPNVNGTPTWGASKNWANYSGSPAWVLKTGAPDPYTIFTNTINEIGAGWANTDDERAIKAAFHHISNYQNNSCYRTDASIAVIILSDEDERSVGGDISRQFYPNEYKPLESEDTPTRLAQKVRQTFGQLKPFSVNSIIVKPGDAACMADQDGGGAKSHEGFKYKEISDMTQGYTGSICDADYSQNLYYFKDKIIRSLASIPLECAPVGPVAVSITPAMGGVSTQVINNTLHFTPAIPAGRTVTIEYDCPMH